VILLQATTSGFPGRLLASSADLGGAWIQASVIDVVDDKEWTWAPRPQHTIVCTLSRRRVTRESEPAEAVPRKLLSGRVALLPAGWSGVLRGPAGKRLFVSLDKEILEEAWRRHVAMAMPPPGLVAAFDVRDILIENVCEMLVEELAEPKPGSKLVFEGAAMTLTAHLLRGTVQFPARAASGLPWRSRERLLKALRADIPAVASVRELAAIAGLSRFHFIRQFKLAFGVTPMQFIENERMTRAQAMLLEGKRSVSEIAMALGYSEHSHFTRRFKAKTGVTPTEFARGATRSLSGTPRNIEPSLSNPSRDGPPSQHDDYDRHGGGAYK
jgi:AraC family transcriptional regulator